MTTVIAQLCLQLADRSPATITFERNSVISRQSIDWGNA
jgi:hypothetical protein